MENIIRVNDELCLSQDSIAHQHIPGLWAKTRIIGGYGVHKNEYGVSELDEVVFETTNMVPLSGVQYAMETLFGVKGPVINVPRLDDVETGIGKYNEDLRTGGVIEGTGVQMPYQYGQRVCLFGVGTGGAGDNPLSAKEVKYTEGKIDSMVPFRYTTDVLVYDNTSIYGKYYGRKDDGNIKAYYLKSFDEEPKIHHCYKNGIDDTDGKEIDYSIVYNQESTNGIETFTQMQLTISKEDIREYFSYNGVEQPRINSIGLFTAVYDEQAGDYSNIMLFSKFNIPTEPLSLEKSMTILYRVYGA